MPLCQILDNELDSTICRVGRASRARLSGPNAQTGVDQISEVVHFVTDVRGLLTNLVQLENKGCIETVSNYLGH
jgi:hypothetical protein